VLIVDGGMADAHENVAIHQIAFAQLLPRKLGARLALRGDQRFEALHSFDLRLITWGPRRSVRGLVRPFGPHCRQSLLQGPGRFIGSVCTASKRKAQTTTCVQLATRWEGRRCLAIEYAC